MSNPFLSKRYGHFQISIDVLKDLEGYKKVLKVLEDVFIIRCEYMYNLKLFQYVGVSKHFEVQEEGTPANLYDVVFNEDTSELSFSHVRNRDNKEVKQ